MPTYDYACERCGHRLEAFQSMSEPPLRRCPECGRAALQRQIGTGAGILFKGSGFYETDYKRPPAAKSGSGPAASEAAPKADKPAATPKPDKPTG